MAQAIAGRTRKKAKAVSLWPSIWRMAQERGLRPGNRLPSIRELAEGLNVKQTVVRDALLKAETQGLITVRPRAGVFLAGEPDPSSSDEVNLADVFQNALTGDRHNLFHLLDARRLIEIELAGRAAERRRLEDLLPVRRVLDEMLQLPVNASRVDYVELDVRFHNEIARLSGNIALFAIQQTLMGLLRPHLNDVSHDGSRRTVTDRSHVAIYEALVAGDAERVREELRIHLSLAYDCLLQDLRQPPAMLDHAARRSAS